MIGRVTHFVLPFAVVTILIVVGIQPAWLGELSGDIFNYYYRAGSHYLLGQAFPAMNLSDFLIYPPGANLLFIVAALSLLLFNHPLIFAFTFVMINAALAIFLYFRISKAFPNGYNHLIYLLLLLSSGPLFLFRFDMAVMTLLILGLLAFRRQRLVKAGFFLGAAASIKFFPLLLLPLLVLFLRRQGRRKIGEFLAAVTFGILLIFAGHFLLTGQSGITGLRGLDNRLWQSVHIESVMGTFLTLVAGTKFALPPPIEFNGVFRLTFYYLLGHDRLFRLILPATMTVIYGLILMFRKRIPAFFDAGLLLLPILGLVIGSQILSPQYLYWPFLLIPLLEPKALTRPFWIVNIVLACLAFMFIIPVYPLNYNLFVFDFYGRWGSTWTFYAVLIRNLLLVILELRLIISLWKGKTDARVKI